MIVDINLVPEEGQARPSELVLSHWPGNIAGWSYDRAPFRNDSAAGIYYAPAPLEPGHTGARVFVRSGYDLEDGEPQCAVELDGLFTARAHRSGWSRRQ